MMTVSQLAHLGLFDSNAPRYTSYPTAPHFDTAVGASDHEAWIEKIPSESTFSLYLHVPFCRRLCWFCACRTQGTTNDEPVKVYLEILKAELRMIADRLPAGARIGRLHWGGGTPTLLKPGQIADLARAVRDLAPFADNAEFSVEIDPNEIDADRADVLMDAGMNRVSIGVQDFAPKIQEIIGRPQSFEITRDAVELFRDRGITSLNTDILYGLPRQTPEGITETVQKLLSLTPDRVALYGYAHVPWMSRRQSVIPTDTLPVPQDRLQLFQTARRLFSWDGYAEIGIDHFARPGDGLARAQSEGRLRRNFQGYTDDNAEVLIGVGASSISRFPQGYTQNAPATSAHNAAIRDGRFATSRGHAFTGDDKLRARLIEELMCRFRIDTDRIVTEFGIDRASVETLYDKLDARLPDVARRSADGISLPEESRALTRIVARCFDAYGASQTGHSTAI
ncbi:oxygen-independent coproporphyrinogen III oxidase [Chachezhania antarctica]|uniref:oxygen-independent coproporphyrinogen III oxidase n=1 Tax=Chachezhania antarctica TaxID=2340860 RepID=UPI000EB02B7A|nr:oxygen-independent coproporphyrinogen III oxidase [Chachezhania antarctica]|tara:strand:+ start:276 stop:1631 length:1356 start_codon:yes stop_codon:yes gene_type:complete